MIDKVFDILINDHLTPYLVSKLDAQHQAWVVPFNLSDVNDANADATKGKIIMSLVNIEEDRVYNINETRVRSNLSISNINQKPPVYLNLYILFASNFESDANGLKYLDGLKVISFVTQFFQHQNVFTQENSPRLKESKIEELIFDLRTLSFQDLNNLWGVLGSKYMPSVLYKVRMLTINEDFVQGAIPVIQKISVNDKVIQ